MVTYTENIQAVAPTDGYHWGAEVVSGALAGAAGVWALDKVAWFLWDRESAEAKQKEIDVRKRIGEGEGGPASTAARKICERMDQQWSDPQMEVATKTIHYGLGILPGILFAMLLERTPKAGAGQGLLYGLTLFLINDELMATKLGLSAPPREYPWQAHARGLAGHLAMGFVTFQGIRLLRTLLGR